MQQAAASGMTQDMASAARSKSLVLMCTIKNRVLISWVAPWEGVPFNQLEQSERRRPLQSNISNACNCETIISKGADFNKTSQSGM
jgi:hypothetical protein